MRARTVTLRLISTASIVTVLSMIGATTSGAQAKPGSLGTRASDALKTSSDDKPTTVASKPATSKTTSEPAAKPKAETSKPKASESKPKTPETSTSKTTQGSKAKATNASKPAAGKEAKPPKPKKQVSSAEAVGLSREILVKHGYQVVRVETLKDSEVIYYRAGNNGRGRGQGALRKMIVRPYGNIVTFEAAPERVRYDIRMHLGF